MSKQYLGFHKGIEPLGLTRFLEIPTSKNWTTSFLTKWVFLSKRRRLFLISSTGTLFYYSFVFSYRSGIWPGGLWANGFPVSILELNQWAVHGFLKYFHQGIEPLFYSGFPHKTDLFSLFVTFCRRLCLIYITGTPPLSLLFLLRRYFFVQCFLNGKGPLLETTLDLKRRTLSRKERSHSIYFRTHFWTSKAKPQNLTPELDFWRLPVFAHKTDLFIRWFAHKTAVFQPLSLLHG